MPVSKSKDSEAPKVFYCDPHTAYSSLIRRTRAEAIQAAEPSLRMQLIDTQKSVEKATRTVAELKRTLAECKRPGAPK